MLSALLSKTGSMYARAFSLTSIPRGTSIRTSRGAEAARSIHNAQALSEGNCLTCSILIRAQARAVLRTVVLQYLQTRPSTAGAYHSSSECLTMISPTSSIGSSLILVVEGTALVSIKPADEGKSDGGPTCSSAKRRGRPGDELKSLQATDCGEEPGSWAPNWCGMAMVVG